MKCFVSRNSEFFEVSSCWKQHQSIVFVHFLLKMSESCKDKPDWLNDFQNKQTESTEQSVDAKSSNTNDFEFCWASTEFASPRYGRRSFPGAKSVGNSPTKKVTPNETKTATLRSYSARPSLLRGKSLTKEFCTNKDSNDDTLLVLQDDFENLFISNSLKSPLKTTAEEESNSRRNNYEKLEDSWNSLHFFNIRQEGRLGCRKRISEPANDKSSADTVVSQFKNENNFAKSPQLSVLSDRKEYLVNSQNIINNSKLNLTAETLGIIDIDKNFTCDLSPSKKIEKDFIIPELPQGQSLVFNIKSTWGDKHYLGLNGIEIFNSQGEKVQIKSVSRIDKYTIHAIFFQCDK